MGAICRSTTRVCAKARNGADLVTLLLLAGWLIAAAAPAETNRIVVRVNDRIATLHDYEEGRRQLIEALRRSNLPAEQLQERLADVGVEVMSDLLEEKLLLSRADQIDAAPTRDEIEDAVQRARDQAGVTTDEDFRQGLAASGFTPESFREHLKKNLTMSGVIGREVRPRIRLNEEDLRRYYQQNLEDFRLPVRLNVRETVILDTATTSEEGRAAIADELRGRLLAGEDPEAVVGEYAEKGLTTEWIPIGWVGEGDLDPALEEAIWDLGTGDFSSAVAARGGLHLFEVLDRQEATIQEFAAVADEIEQQETNRRFAAEIGDYLAELERNSHVVIKPPPEAAAFRSVLTRRRDEGLEIDERQRALAGVGLGVIDPSDPGDEPESSEPSDDGGDGERP